VNHYFHGNGPYHQFMTALNDASRKPAKLALALPLILLHHFFLDVACIAGGSVAPSSRVRTAGSATSSCAISFVRASTTAWVASNRFADDLLLDLLVCFLLFFRLADGKCEEGRRGEGAQECLFDCRSGSSILYLD
jgi:hypothetical protein